MAKILIAIPTYDKKIDIDILSSVAALTAVPHHEISITWIAGSIIQNSRNYLCRVFLEHDGKFDWLYFWDADMVIKDVTFVDKLLETSEKLDADIVGGIYRIKAPGERLSVGYYTSDARSPFESENYKLGEVTEPRLVDCLATGSMLIKRTVLETIPAPWFEFRDYAEHTKVWPEDYNFCDKAWKHGFKVAADPRFSTYHYGYAAWAFPSGGSRP